MRRSLLPIVLALAILLGAAHTSLTSVTPTAEAACASGTRTNYATNGHDYQLICSSAPLTWSQAKTAAEGLGAHLATITSAGENTFLAGLTATKAWIGGFQPAGSTEPAGGWTWLAGDSWSFTSWAPTEPNNCHTPCLPEDSLAFNDGGNGRWNDLPNSPTSTTVDFYIAEWDAGTGSGVNLECSPDSVVWPLTAPPTLVSDATICTATAVGNFSGQVTFACDKQCVFQGISGNLPPTRLFGDTSNVFYVVSPGNPAVVSVNASTTARCYASAFGCPSARLPLDQTFVGRPTEDFEMAITVKELNGPASDTDTVTVVIAGSLASMRIECYSPVSSGPNSNARSPQSPSNRLDGAAGVSAIYGRSVDVACYAKGLSTGQVLLTCVGGVVNCGYNPRSITPSSQVGPKGQASIVTIRTPGLQRGTHIVSIMGTFAGGTAQTSFALTVN